MMTCVAIPHSYTGRGTGTLILKIKCGKIPGYLQALYNAPVVRSHPARLIKSDLNGWEDRFPPTGYSHQMFNRRFVQHLRGSGLADPGLLYLTCVICTTGDALRTHPALGTSYPLFSHTFYFKDLLSAY